MCKYQEYTLSLFFSLLFTFNSLNPKINMWILICFPYSLPGIILWLLIWLVNQINNQSIKPSTDVIQLSLTLKMTTAQVVETSVTFNNNSPIQDYVHPDSTYFWNDSWVQTFHSFMISTVDSKQWFAATQQGSHVGWKNNTFFSRICT